MRKLFLIISLFVAIILGLILIYNTVLNTTKQLQPTTQPQLEEVELEGILDQALVLPTVAASSDQDWQRYHTFLKARFELLFQTTNVTWQRFQKYSLVGKWAGQNSNLKPIVLVVSPNTYQMIQDSNVVNQTSKVASLSLFASLTKILDNKVQPDRTIYLVLAHNPTAEKQIIAALSVSKRTPYMILKTGGTIAANGFWNLNRPVGFIGVGNKSHYSGQWLLKDSIANVEQVMEDFNQKVMKVTPKDKVVRELIDYIGPEVTFDQRILWSNQWLLERLQSSQLSNNEMTQQLFGQEVNYNILKKKSISILQLQWTEERVLLKGRFNPLANYKGFTLIDSTLKFTQKSSYYSSTTSPAYRMISSTFKEVYTGGLTAPCRVQDAFFDYYAAICPNVYYFTPLSLVTNPATKEAKEQNAIQLKKSTQFYYRLLESIIKE